ncbi:hypothetical protein BaRGS_00025449, partial [Batillaria attramentaria]
MHPIILQLYQSLGCYSVFMEEPGKTFGLCPSVTDAAFFQACSCALNSPALQSFTSVLENSYKRQYDFSTLASSLQRLFLFPGVNIQPSSRRFHTPRELSDPSSQETGYIVCTTERNKQPGDSLREESSVRAKRVQGK